MKISLQLSLALLVVLVGCENSTFSGGGGSKAAQAGQQTAGEGEGAGQDSNGDGIPDRPFTEIATEATAAGKTVESFDGAEKAPIDILFAVDTSGSMTSEKNYLETNMKGFMDKFLAANTSAQITAIGAEDGAFSFPADLPADKFAVVAQKVGSHDAIGIIMNYFDGQYQTNLPLRDGASLEVVIISDDDGANSSLKTKIGSTSTGTRNMAADFVPPAGKRTRVHGIVGLETSQEVEGVCELANIGKEHIALAQKYSGTLTDICTQDWSKLLSDLSQDIINANRSIILKSKPEAGSLEVYVGDRRLAAEEFTFDEANNRLTVKDEVQVGEGEKFNVIYKSAA